MSYWHQTLQRRLSRRRSLTGAGGFALGAAFLAACGGNESESKPDTSSLAVKAEDTTKQAKRGGIYKASIATDAGSWDPHVRGAWFGTLGGILYSRLTIVKPGEGESTAGDIIGDLAESWEFSPDGLTATFKLRPTAKFQPVAPVNSRTVEAQDVATTWTRWKSVSGTRATIDNSINPDAPVISVSATDARTVVMKLAIPAVTLPSLLAASVGQAFHIMPKEAGENGYDPRKTQIGSGPFYVSDQVASSYIHLKRHPGFYDTNRPYFDGMEFPIVSEYATGLAAFRNGQIYQYAVRAEEVLGVKRDVPDLSMYQSDLAIPQATLFFGYKNNPRGMFRDKRLRQAYSMTIDRDLFAETWYNVSSYTKQGLPVRTGWSSAVPATEYTGWWIDPRDKSFGPNAKYYQHNVAEAKKLVSAAGFPAGVDYVSTRAGGNYGPEYDRQIEIMEGMAAEAGFKPKANVIQYQNDLIPNYQNVQGEFEGSAWMLRPQSSSDPIDKLAENMFSKSGDNFIGFDPNGKGDHSGDPFVDDQIRKSRVERDTNKRKQIMGDLQRHLGDQMYLIRPVSGATGFDLAWPALKNYLYFRGARRAEEWSYFWLDTTKKPLGNG
ncbi:MAG TPA: ABC transporter substrate-binding protein [Dehalococcoidia bacterium]|nr:ABC transporter substrate-binding protein [Dehalococcoidia bacterium]